MNSRKVAPVEIEGKSAVNEEYDQYIALDWSETIMAVARTTDPRRQPQAFERQIGYRGIAPTPSVSEGAEDLDLRRDDQRPVALPGIV